MTAIRVIPHGHNIHGTRRVTRKAAFELVMRPLAEFLGEPLYCRSCGTTDPDRVCHNEFVYDDMRVTCQDCLTAAVTAHHRKGGRY